MLRSRLLTTFIFLCSLILFVVGDSGADTETVRKALLELSTADKAGRESIFSLLQKEGDAGLVPILEAYSTGLLEVRDGKLVIYGPRVQTSKDSKHYPILDAFTGKPLLDDKRNPVVAEELGKSRLQVPRAERRLVADMIKVLSLQHSDPSKRIAAIHAAGDRGDASVIGALRAQVESNPGAEIRSALEEAIAQIQVLHGSGSEKITAAEILGDYGSLRAAASLRKALEASGDEDAELSAALQKALTRADRVQERNKFLHNLFSGLSLGSILILMALGLAVIFGLMGVINMAHGEFMMLGAFTTYVVCEAFKRYLPPGVFDYYFLCALPVSFLFTAAAGWVCEWALIRHLYGRPLETLLATWGLSLVLIQAVRVLFGDTLSLTPPEWLTGSWEVARDLAFPVNRLFIVVFCAGCTLVFYGVVQKTKLGLLLRSTVQDRDTASSLGVAVRRVDGFTFALGTGLAGLAGCVIPLYDKINPGMGQGYVVESFMVVVLGGLGKLAGVIIGGLGLGFLTKFIEPFLQAVYGKAVVLGLIIVFLQWRPSGLFPSKGRLAEE
ncbi:MAG: urea ABC transporter permease subunit UrtB [Thermodesulfobacteriota bacterium]